MNKVTSFKITKDLFLNRVEVNTARPSTIEQPKPVHHVLVIDCSYSMVGDLPKVRRHVIEQLPKLINEGDMLSLVWFSGRRESGVVFEFATPKTLADLKTINNVVNRWIAPIGATSFFDPLVECVRIAEDQAKDKTMMNHSLNLIFMSDGHNNDAPRSDVLAQSKLVGDLYDASTIVEYGYYADRGLLTQMAENMGASYLFAEEFQKYGVDVDGAITRASTTCRPLIHVQLPEVDPVDNKVFTLGPAGLMSLPRDEGGGVYMPEPGSDVYFLSTDAAGSVSKNHVTLADGLYGALTIFAREAKPKVIRPILAALGDVRLTKKFAGCFGKQKYTDFMTSAENAAYSENARLVEGYDPNFVHNPNVTTVLDVLNKLQADEDARILLDDKSFSYSRISRAREDASDDAIKVTYVPSEDGYPLLDLTWNEDRPNISMLVRREVTLDLKGRIPEKLKGKIPETFPTHVFRNYTIVRDGLINVANMPVKASAAAALGTPMSGEMAFSIPLEGMPVVNDAMVDSVDAMKLFALYHQLQIARAEQKVYKKLRDESLALASAPLAADLVALYGKEGAAWLESIGVSKNGYAPVSTKQVESKDYYVGHELSVKLKGFNSLPSVEDVRKRIASKKPMIGVTQFMANCIERVETMTGGMDEKRKRAWLMAQADLAIAETRALIRQVAFIKYAVILGQVWFPGFEYGEAKTVYKGIECEAKLEEVQIKI